MDKKAPTGVLFSRLAASLVALAIAIVSPAESAVAKQRALYVFDGDSISVLSPRSWPIQLIAQNLDARRADIYDIARRGSKTILLRRDFARQVDILSLESGRRAYFFLFAGSVDLARGTHSAEAIYDNLSWMWQSARNKGYCVVAFTVKPARAITGLRDAERRKLNDLILAHPERYDGIVRTDLIFSNPLDGKLLLPDGMHLTKTGNIALAKAADNLLRSAPWQCSNIRKTGDKR